MPEPGDRAPDFTLPDHSGESVSLSDFYGKWVVLYFYPRDNTPGCTKEARDFSDEINLFHELNAVIIGVSPDRPSSHSRFMEKYGLKVILLSDPDKEVLKKYGAWGEKKNYGKVYQGAIRSTYIINPEGEVAAKWSNVRVRSKRKGQEVKHASLVREELKRLKESR